MSAMQRRKGMRGELEVAEILREVFPHAARRSSGEESQVDQGRDIKGTPGLCVQVQHTAGPTTPEKKLREAEAAASAEEIPLAFVRRDRCDWLVAIRPRQLLALMVKAGMGGTPVPSCSLDKPVADVSHRD